MEFEVWRVRIRIVVSKQSILSHACYTLNAGYRKIREVIAGIDLTLAISLSVNLTHSKDFT